MNAMLMERMSYEWEVDSIVWAYNARVAVRPPLSSSTKEALHGTDLPYFVRTESGLAASILPPPLAPYHIARIARGRIFLLSGRWSTWPWNQQMLDC